MQRPRSVTAVNFSKMLSIILLLLLRVPLTRSAAGLCTGDVKLTIGIDPGMVASSYVPAIATAFAVNRSTTVGYTVAVNVINVPPSSVFQTTFTQNAAGQLSAPVHAIVLASDNVYQQASSPISFASFPIIATAIVVVYNLPTVPSTHRLQLTLDQISNIYLRNISHWDNPLLNVNNPGLPALPHEATRPVVRIDGATGTKIFTTGLSNGSDIWRAAASVFSDPQFVSPDPAGTTLNASSWPGGVGSNFYGYKDGGVVFLVQDIPYAVGYLTQAIAATYDATYAAIQNDAGAYTVPTPSSVQVAMAYVWTQHVGGSVSNLSVSAGYRLQLIEFTEMGIFTHYDDCCVAQEIIALVQTYFSSTAAAIANNFVPTADLIVNYVDSQILQQITCGAAGKVVNPYNDGYLVSIAPPNLAQENVGEIAGIVIAAFFVVVVGAGIFIGTMVVQNNKEKEERQWILEPGAVIPPSSIGQPEHRSTRPETHSSSQTSGTVYTLGEMKFPMKPAKMFEDGQFILLQSVPLPPAKHWKAVTKAYAFAQYRAGIQVPPTVAKFVGAWANAEAMSTCLIYEFCAKGTVHYVLKSYGVRFEHDIRYNMAYDVACGMKYLHEKKIIHGSLSSLSTYVDSNWNVKISGWMENPLSRLEKIESFKQHQTAAKASAGNEHIANFEDLVSLFYLEPSEDVAPHQMSDVYSFGLLVVEIFSGMPPYKNDVYGASEMSLTSKDLATFLRQKFLQLCAPPPNLDDMQQIPQVVKNMIFKCIGSFNRPTFDNLALLINEHRPVKHNIVDLMMEKMENYVHSLEMKVEERTTELTKLLHEMLPPQIATDLLAGRTVTPEYFECISVCFLDVCGFTTLSSLSSPIEILSFLNSLWSDFDTIVSQVDAYKVDTIGDAYMVCSGLPNRNGRTHVKVACNLALSFLACAKSFRIKHRPDEQLKIRLGLNAGPAVAGVVGKTMPQYCVFGDTVNTAARMESTSEPLKIQMSDYMKTLVSGYYPDDYKIAHRGEVKVKGKGMMNTYWLFGKNDMVPVPQDGVQPYRNDSP